MPVTDEAQVRALIRRAPAHPRVVSSGASVAPLALLGLVDDELDTYRLNIINASPGVPVRAGVEHETVFIGPGVRGLPGLRYTPCRLSLVPYLFESTFAPDIVLAHVSPPRNGRVSLGIEVMTMVAAIESARARGALVLGQVNAAMPYTFGDGELDVTDFDALYESDLPLALPDLPTVDPSPDFVRIGELTAARVADGATLQLGIGAAPDATLPGLAARRHLGIWSEMFSDGVLRLERAGALDSRRDIVGSFVVGSAELYEWMHLNPRVVMRRTEVVNNPGVIARQPQLTSINTALQIDLLGQANASRVRGRVYSGFGGQTDFIVGALHSRGGQALMALRSIHPKTGTSTIVPRLEEPVTSFQHSAVITEQGVAEVFGYPEAEQRHNLIERAAHPDARPLLREAASELVGV